MDEKQSMSARLERRFEKEDSGSSWGSDAFDHENSRSRRRMADFIEADRVADSAALDSPTVNSLAGRHRILKTLRRKVRDCLRSPLLDLVQGSVVAFDVLLGVFETDIRAAGEDVPRWIMVCGDVCLVSYLLEVLATLFVRHAKALTNTWVLLDIIIVVAGFSASLIEAVTRLPSEGVRRLLYLFRVIRLVRVFRKFRYFRSLQKLVKIIVSCTRTLFWSFIFCFVIMTIWSMLAVEVLAPLMPSLAETGVFADCDSCKTAFSSVMRTNLTFFQTIIAGDSWGRIAVPMIEAYPLSSVIFCGSLLSIVFGILNMIVAVVVDEFADKRAKDFVEMGEEMDMNRQEDLEFLQTIFEKLDEDNDGELDFIELLHGARKIPEFCHRLRVMDIDESDLIQLFEMIDSDGSGTVGPKEFITALSRWLHDSKTASRFVKYNVMRNLENQEAMRQEFQEKFTQMQGTLEIVLHAVQAAFSETGGRAVSATSLNLSRCLAPIGADSLKVDPRFGAGAGAGKEGEVLCVSAALADSAEETSDVTWSRRFNRHRRRAPQRAATQTLSSATDAFSGSGAPCRAISAMAVPEPGRIAAVSQDLELALQTMRQDLDSSLQKALGVMQECLTLPESQREVRRPSFDGMEALSHMPGARKPDLPNAREEDDLSVQLAVRFDEPLSNGQKHAADMEWGESQQSRYP